ncbi:VOC family protein [Streptomyces syringium]|uniref:VOC family protein n=1 Tax=Streptomyces syringium TaxID=76729 RepID=UPI00342FAD5B
MPVVVPDYHLGVVVTDLDRAMAELTDLLGVRWLSPVRSGNQITDGRPTGDGPMMTFSAQGPPYLELLELVPGSIWSTPGMHHVGYWAADAPAESARLAEAGSPLEAAAVVLAGDTEPGVFYHRTTDGLLLELVEMGRGGPALAHYLSGAGG